MALPPDRIHFYIQVSDGATGHASAGRGHFMRARGVATSCERALHPLRLSLIWQLWHA